MPGAFGLCCPGQGFVLARAAGGEAEILTLAVCPRRGGGASARAAGGGAGRRRAAGAAAMFLEVAAGNDAARGLYAGLASPRSAGGRATTRTAGMRWSCGATWAATCAAGPDRSSAMRNNHAGTPGVLPAVSAGAGWLRLARPSVAALPFAAATWCCRPPARFAPVPHGPVRSRCAACCGSVLRRASNQQRLPAFHPVKRKRVRTKVIGQVSVLMSSCRSLVSSSWTISPDHAPQIDETHCETASSGSICSATGTGRCARWLKKRPLPTCWD